MPNCKHCLRYFDNERSRSIHQSQWCWSNPTAEKRKANVEGRQLRSSFGSTVSWRGERFPSETERAMAEVLWLSDETYTHWPEPLMYWDDSSNKTRRYHPDFLTKDGHYIEPGSVSDRKMEKLRAVERDNDVTIEVFDSQQVFTLLSKLRD